MLSRELQSIREAEEQARSIVNEAFAEARRRRAAAEEEARIYEETALSEAEKTRAERLRAAEAEGTLEQAAILKQADKDVRALRFEAEKRLAAAARLIVERVTAPTS